MTPAPHTLARVAPASVIIRWLRELAQQAAAPSLIHCPATLPSVGVGQPSLNQ